ncbi:MAG TPA: DNA mismatch repair endonuclease MutL, partial [Deltaproteobacteria bacterium]|nr:DNA mismatch repair endonuclease MutL [Deltaproteobacteria bacterium]
TSKIRSTDDLFSIRTLGFRGEALPSILSVSRAMLSTRRPEDSHGSALAMEGGTVTRRSSRGMPPGTVIEVNDLFYNTPARRKFLKTAATEQRTVMDVVSRYALAFPSVRFTLVMNGRTVMNLAACTDLRHRVPEVLGRRLAGILIPFSRRQPGIAVHGLLAPPTESRQNRTGIHCFVNSRAVKDVTLGAAVMEGYSGLLMRGRYPVAVLFVDIDPAEVDVNVHPAKAEVRFRHSGAVFGLVASCIRDALALTQAPADGVQSLSASLTHAWAAPAPCSTAPLAAADAGHPVYGLRAGARRDTALLFEPGQAGRTDGFSYADKGIVGMLHATYVLLQDDASLYILDQHAAHERITYERLRSAYSGQTLRTQDLLTPLVLELNAREFSAYQEAEGLMRAAGFESEPFGDTSVAVRSVPQPLAWADIRETVMGLIHAVMAGDIPPSAAGRESLDRVLATAACHASVRAGRALTMEEARNLLSELDRTGAPQTCPHGRPLFRRIDVAEIEKWMGRRI